MTLTQIESVTAISAVAVPAMYYLTKAVRRWVRRAVELASRIDCIYKEVQPNGGGSIKDKVDKLSTDVMVLRAGLSFSLALNPHCVFETDERGNCTFSNLALCELYGLSAADMAGRGWLEALEDSASRERAWETWIACVTKKIPYLDRYCVRNARTGERFWVRAHATPAGPADRPLHYYGTVEREV